MSIESRPYAGTWRLDQRKLVQHTPDCLVFVNGDTAIPGCPKCNGRIDIQKFLTEVSVDAGCDPNGASASMTLSVPLHHTDSFARDARFILRPGLEIHVYMRGYFPVKGMYSNLAEPVARDLGVQGADANAVVTKKPKAQGAGYLAGAGLTQDEIRNRGVGVYRAAVQPIIDENLPRFRDEYPTERLQAITKAAAAANGIPPEWIWGILGAEGGAHPIGFTKGDGTVGADQSVALGMSQMTLVRYDEMKRTSGDKVWWDHADLVDPKVSIWATALEMGRLKKKGVKDDDGARVADFWAGGHSDQRDSRAKRIADSKALFKNVSATGDDALPPVPQTASHTSEAWQASGETGARTAPDDVRLDQYGLEESGVEDVIAYPYYHVFHGVVTSVSHSISGGSQTITMTCASMLNFWQYHTISTNASVFGARPQNSKLRSNLIGHNFTGMHPYEIMYTLHHDVAGAAGSVGWAMSQKSNQTASSDIASGESLFSLNIKYWERRFAQNPTRLRMHGARGDLFSAAQAEFLGRLSSSQLTSLVSSRFTTPEHRRGNRFLSRAYALGLFNKRRLEALKVNNDPGNMELDMSEILAFVSDIGQWGQPALFESVYESKLNIASKVCEVTGFEFYQDVDGDFVFKPPMYNLDTSESRVYRIEDQDIISLSFDEGEPAATYITVKGSQFKNLAGTGTDGEWGVQGQYIDYRLVAQYGWRPESFETAYYNDPKAMFFAAVNRLDILNAPTRKASLTIPIRPELRPGYPVYITYLDCFYYCNSFAHAYNVGGQCTTAMQLIAKRAKFYGPGRPSKTGIESIDLANTSLPEKPLQVSGAGGKPALSGFPNVVMALDPTKINPLFFVVGSDIENLDSEERLLALLDMGVQMGVLEAEKDGDGWTYTTEAGKDTSGAAVAAKVRFVIPAEGDAPKKGPKGKEPPAGSIDLLAAAHAQSKQMDGQAERLDVLKQKARDASREVTRIQQLLSKAQAKARAKEAGNG